MAADLARHLAALADPRTRPGAAAAVASCVGATAIVAFVPHADVPTKLVPAAGFVPSLPTRHGWAALLARCAEPGIYEGAVAYPTAEASAPATAYAFAGVTIVVVGGGVDPALHAELAAVSPFLAAILGGENREAALHGDLAVARAAAEQAATLARALDAARSEAERATRVKDEFLAMLGHELRNPLAPIVTALQMLRLQGLQSRAQDVLERQVSHMLRLVDDLLDVSRITRGKVELRRERTEIGAVIVRAIEMVRPLFEERRNRLVNDVPSEGLVVEGDPARLAQVFSNLLTNASKYSDRDTEIRVTAELAGTTVRVRVEDHGIGIAPEFLDRVFDQFVQLPQGIDRAVGGLGLGLAIVRNLVERHGGRVRAQSAGLGRGSQFIVELPRCTAAVASSTAATAAVASRGSSGRADAILIVDDNGDAAEMLGEVLESHGYRVRVASSGPDALELVEAFEPRAALLDIGLPVMDGYELAAKLRARFPDIRLAALTGYGQREDRERSVAAGFDAHLVKPVSVANVTETLDRLLR
jgi:signal transduction histidine kinase/CheY-like chemotaxis protein